MNNTSQINMLKRLNGFMNNVYEPLLHISFSLFWFLSLAGFLMIVSDAKRPFDMNIEFIAGVLTLFLVLFFLRVADEIKDFEYDKLYNPDRPLVSKRVTFNDLYIFLAGSALLTIVINITLLGWIFAAIVILDMLYGLFLIWLEKKALRIADGMFLNLLVTYPVNIALSIYIFMFCHENYTIELSLKTAVAMIVFVAAFLHHEIGRKTCWPHKVKEDKRHYSSEIGGPGSALLAGGIALFATLGVFILSAPWNRSGIGFITGAMILLSLVPAFWGVYKFFQSEKKSISKSSDAPMTTFAMGYLSLFYLFLTLHLVAVCGVSFSAGAIIIIFSGCLAWLTTKWWVKDISTTGSIYINSTEQFIAGNDMFVTADFKVPLDPEKLYGVYEKLIKNNNYLQSKWSFDEKKKKYTWANFNEDELDQLLDLEKKHILKFHNADDIYSEYISTNKRLPFRISLINENQAVLSFNHVFTNGLNIFRWIEKLLSEYFEEPMDDEAIISRPGIMLRLKSCMSVVFAGIYMAKFLKNKGDNFESETVDLTYGKNPVKSEKGYSIKSYTVSEAQTSQILLKAGENGSTVSEYICAVFSETFFDNAPDKNRICISAPTDLIGLVPGAGMYSAGNHTGSLIFQVFKNKDTGQQVKEAFKQFRNLVPFGTAKIMNLLFSDHRKMKDHFLKMAKQPFNERDPLSFYTFAFSNVGVIDFHLIKKYLASCTGHTKNQTIFIGRVTLNGKLSIEISVSNDLYDAGEVFGIMDEAVGRLERG